MTTELAGVEIQVDKLVPGGDGFARLTSGEVLFIQGGVPGDRIRVRSAERRRGVLRTSDYELLAPSPDRVVPECPIADRCGGCDMMQLSRSAELAQKSAMLSEALERVAGVRIEPTGFHVGALALAYRSRVRFHIGREGKLGFFARSSHQLVEVPACAVADPRINQALTQIRRLARRFPEALLGFSDVELRATEEGVIARFMPRDGIRPIAAEPLLRALAQQLAVAGSEREAAALVERRTLSEQVFVEIPADAFSQINAEVNRLLVAAVVEGALSRGLTSFCDLFAGVGNFALPLAQRGLTGVMVEKAASAVRGAEQAAAKQGLQRLRMRTADAQRALQDLVREGQRFELVVLDPPREGAAEVAAGIAGLAPRWVAYVACDPVTLSRDLRPLLAAGMRIHSVEAFDMFPRTHHFESLVWLEGRAP